MATIRCQACGDERQRCPSNTKFCIPCRVLKDVEFWADRPKDCESCGERFVPTRRGDRLCGSCQLGYSGWKGTCKLCGTEDAYLIHSKVTVCKECAHDPKCRRRFVAGLRNGQRDRATQNHHNQETP